MRMLTNRPLQFIMRSHLFFLIVTLFIACSNDEFNIVEPVILGDPVRIAVVLPLDKQQKEIWENTAAFAIENILQAQVGLANQIRPEIEWYDENTADISSLMKTLAQRKDIAAIIGPYQSSHSLEAAYQCAKTDKTLFTLSTSAELIRVFSQKHNFLWALSETDISQCEVLLSKVLYYQGKSVSLIANDDIYGQTFIDWFAFQAKELGLEARGIHLIGGDAGEAYRKASADQSDFIIVAASTAEEVQDILESSLTLSDRLPGTSRMLFSDTAFTPNLEASDFPFRHIMIEGVAVCPNPSSGFETLFESRYGILPNNGVPPFYDAITLISYAAFMLEQGIHTDMNEAIKQLVDGREPCQSNWRAEGMARVFKAIENGKMPDIDGCTGQLEFDSMVYTNVLHSTYCNWLAYDARFTILGYTGSNGSNRVEETLAGWNWRNDVMQNFENGDISFVYPPLQNQWALLIAASTGWNNYRHQADIFAIYQQLKQVGYDDHHIVLIAEDDLIDHFNNPYPGAIYIAENGDNVRQNVQIDYKLSELTPTDLIDILTGNVSDRLPHVIASGAQDNVFLFWSGHGVPGALCWNDIQKGFTTEMARSLFEKMSKQKCYRKLIGFIETCYSGSVLKSSEGIPGMLFFTAAGEQETSKADVFSYDLRTYLSNRFTRIFIERITENKHISLRELYLDLFRNTLGSHVMLYNADYFDNIYRCDMAEFL